MKYLWTLFTTVCLLSQTEPAASLGDRLAELDLAKYSAGHETALAIFDLTTDSWTRFDKELCAKRFTPCSTFKVLNSMIGLETGVLVDEQTTFKWDGSKQRLDVWERDHHLASAFKNSVVWYYQRVAREVGATRMQHYLDLADYGNRDISGGIDQFWLQSSFKVSPDEQVVMLKRLFRNELPFSFRSMEITKKIMVHLEGKGYVLQGKTGSGWDTDHFSEGWYIGHLKQGQDDFVFACHRDLSSGQEVRDMLIQIFQDLKLLPEDAVRNSAQPVAVPKPLGVPAN